MILTMPEWSVVLPFLAFIVALILGADSDALRLPFLIAEMFGILLYMGEIKARFKHRGGGRR